MFAFRCLTGPFLTTPPNFKSIAFHLAEFEPFSRFSYYRSAAILFSQNSEFLPSVTFIGPFSSFPPICESISFNFAEIWRSGVFDLQCILSRASNVNGQGRIQLPAYGFLIVLHSYYGFTGHRLATIHFRDTQTDRHTHMHTHTHRSTIAVYPIYYVNGHKKIRGYSIAFNNSY